MATVRKRSGRSTFTYKVKLASGQWKEFSSGMRDKRAAEQMASDHQKLVDRGEVGLVDPFEATRSAKVTELIAEFTKSRAALNRSPRYITGLDQRLTFAFEVMGATFVQDADPTKVEALLGRLVRGEDLPPMKPRTKGGKPIPRRAVSMKTRDGFVEALGAFGNWLQETKRWGSNPFEALRKEARESDRKREHRALDAEELSKLVEAAEVRGPQAYRRSHPHAETSKLEELAAEGWARGTLYLFAAYTGLRFNECDALRWSDIVLAGENPHVVVRATAAKNRTEQRVPLMPWVVERLAELHRRQKESAVRVDGRVPDGAARVFSMRRGLLDALRKDAAWAGLGLHDEHGRTTSFHGFRSSTATLLARAGVSQPHAMRVLRHSDANLTARVYTKLDHGDLHAELLSKLSAPRVASTPVSTQASTNCAPERAAVGCSVPLAEAGTAIARRVEASRDAHVAPELADSCRSVPEAEASGESGGRCRSRRRGLRCAKPRRCGRSEWWGSRRE